MFDARELGATTTRSRGEQFGMTLSRVRPAAQPFRVRIPRSVVARIVRRVRATRLPEPADGDDSWSSGMSASTLRELVSYWTTEYAWNSSEEELNAYPQFRANVDGLAVHFYHVPGGAQNSLPV